MLGRIIKKILNEENQKKEILKQSSLKNGLLLTSKLVGGIENYIKIVYDNNLKYFFKNEGEIEPYIIKGEPPVMYINGLIVDSLNLETFVGKEKYLGDFRFGNKNGTQFKFTARLLPISYHNNDNITTTYKVVGTSGSFGFGLSYITKKETLGKKYRIQIFNQIIDKFKLNEYK